MTIFQGKTNQQEQYFKDKYPVDFLFGERYRLLLLGEYLTLKGSALVLQ